jgi:cyclase
MRRIRIIPTLLLDQGKLVKTTAFRHPGYIGDPMNALRIFNEKEVDEICVLDIMASRRGTPPDLAYLRTLTSECFMPLAYGGGITTLAQATDIFKAGVEKLIFGTAALKQPDLIKSVSEKFGAQAVVGSLDLRKDWLGRPRAFVTSGTVSTGKDPVAWALHLQSLGAGEILLQHIDREGSLTGYDLDLIRSVCEAVNIPVIASGGAAGLGDFLNAIQSGASAVAAGHYFVYKGTHKAVLITYPAPADLMEQVYQKL